MIDKAQISRQRENVEHVIYTRTTPWKNWEWLYFPSFDFHNVLCNLVPGSLFDETEASSTRELNEIKSLSLSYEWVGQKAKRKKKKIDQIRPKLVAR